jgi:hypothetical protein
LAAIDAGHSFVIFQIVVELRRNSKNVSGNAGRSCCTPKKPARQFFGA